MTLKQINMKRNKFLFISLAVAVGLSSACKKELNVQNPNQPTVDAAKTESGIIALAQGSIYVNGLNSVKFNETGFLAYTATGIQDVMGDIIGGEAANAYLNQLGCPLSVTLDDGSVIPNPASPARQPDLIRQINTNAQQSENFIVYEWAYMYNMIAAANNLLANIDAIEFASDADTKKATIQAWAYFWKGFAYSKIGSIYYAGIINNEAFKTNGNYVTKEAIIAEAGANLDQAASVLSGISNDAVYTNMMSKIIPGYFQVGKGGVPSPANWKRIINTMKARNILVNKTVASMSSGDWTEILTLTADGIQPDDNVFTVRTNEAGDYISATTLVAGKTQSNIAGGSTYKLSERWVQEFKAGDKRKDNNVLETEHWIGNSDRGNIFNTRYTLVNGGNGAAGVVVYANTEPGEYEYYLNVTWEENELMMAEAKINSGDIDGGLASVDAVRVDQGAGLPAVSGTGLTLAQAREELRRERRVTLSFRGLSFYDARRWGVIDPIGSGGGRTKAVVLDNNDVLNTNATIDYDFLDYWDVPDNELAYNPAADGSAPVKNPKQ